VTYADDLVILCKKGKAEEAPEADFAAWQQPAAPLIRSLVGGCERLCGHIERSTRSAKQ
jgi:hypothetical protein